MFPKYRWRVIKSPANEPATPQEPSLLARVLSARGLVDVQTKNAFLQRRVFARPALPDLDMAVRRLRAAGEDREVVYIHGDYDVDGLTSTAIMLHALTSLGARVHCRIPDREADGYGLSQSAVAEARQVGATLIVAVDCGTSDVAPVVAARSLGIDVIIIDHHMAHGVFPPALAVVNPQRRDHDISFRHLAAAGVCYLVAQALLDDPATHLVDLAALGTIADVMPLIDINREIAAHGLTAMSQCPRQGIAALAEAARLKFPLCSRDVAYALAPRLNAAGRMGNASRSLDLILAGSMDVARQQALALETENRARQDLEQVMLKEALESAGESGFPVAVFARQSWRRGLLGLLAGRLCESLGRPAAAVSVEAGVGRGSVRSTSDFDVFRALTACSRLLSRYGGHSRAGGFDVLETDIPALVDLLSETSPAYIPGPVELVIDAEARLDELSISAVTELTALEPCGEGNPRPTFILRSAEVSNPRRVGGNSQHLKFAAGQSGFGGASECIWFGAGAFCLPRGPVDLVVEPSVSGYGGRPSIELMVRDMRRSMGASRDYRQASAGSIEITTLRQTPRHLLEAHLVRGSRPYGVWNDTEDIRPHALSGVADLIVEKPPRDPDALRQAVQHLKPGSRVILNFSGDDIDRAVESLLVYAPDRERLAACYRALQPGASSVFEYGARLVSRGIVPEALASVLAETALAMFVELGIVNIAGGGISIEISGRKVDLNESLLFRTRQAEIMPVVEFYDRMCHSVGALMDWLTA